MSGILAQRYEDGKLEGRLEGKLEGKLEGAIEICFSLGMSVPNIVQVIAKEFNFPEDEARGYVNEYQTEGSLSGYRISEKISQEAN